MSRRPKVEELARRAEYFELADKCARLDVRQALEVPNVVSYNSLLHVKRYYLPEDMRFRSFKDGGHTYIVRVK